MCCRGMDAQDADNQGYTPLHIACECGRAENVEVLLKRAKEGLFEMDVPHE